jgi:carboxymethylenebutenolidase
MIQATLRSLFRRLRPWFMGLFALALGTAISLQSCNVVASSPPPKDDFTERMAQAHQGDRPKPTEGAMVQPAKMVTSKMVEYATINGKPVMGFLAQPADAAEAQAPLPGIIAIHEWWGLNDNIKAVSERLAGEGYSVLAVDLYGGAVAQKPDQAKQLMQGVMQTPAPAQDNLRQAYAYLTEQQQAPRVGSIGWCFGGAWSLQTGLLLPEQLDAMVIYYGRLETDPKVLTPLQMPIAGFFGGLDQGIPVADVKAFEAALTGLGKSAEITIYDDANHAFANPSGDRYNPTAAKDAWDKTTAFFERHLKA